jgi:hypothetical protein
MPRRSPELFEPIFCRVTRRRLCDGSPLGSAPLVWTAPALKGPARVPPASHGAAFPGLPEVLNSFGARARTHSNGGDHVKPTGAEPPQRPSAGCDIMTRRSRTRGNSRWSSGTSTRTFCLAWRRSLSCAIELVRGCAGQPRPVRQVQHRPCPARIEELIAAYRRGATAAALACSIPGLMGCWSRPQRLLGCCRGCVCCVA